MVFVVRCGDETRCAKVYKEADERSFRQAVDYTENRKIKNSRQARAMAKGTRSAARRRRRHGRAPRSTRCTGWPRAGVRVPTPYNFHEGVLLMELVGRRARRRRAAAQRCVRSRAEEARAHHATLIDRGGADAGAGVVHGDLSEFNILLGADGPVIIDLPQAVDAAGNNHAQRMLLRDVGNLRDFFGRFAPELLKTDYGTEIWALYQRGTLHPETC